ncbi:MAG TPA: sirohydrochlorin cobaltochelatase [Syntrophobacter fumaroxidans]|nr:sirohydrochlorin cobaltochelatase [Syntrophobacter fumaroxidans]
MNRRFNVVFGLMVFAVLLASHSFAAHGEKQADKKAILIVAFGTTVPEAQKVFDGIDQRVRKEFRNTEIRWGYTSSIVRAKLARQGKVLDSPEVALARLMDEHYTHVAVLSLHTIPGEEFHDLYRNSRLFEQMAGGFKKVAVAPPLLSSHDDMVRVAKAVIGHIPRERKPEETVLLMGHGSEKHPADALYSALNQAFSELDPNVRLATVSGYPSLQDVMPKIAKSKSGKVYLMPFMLVAGDHAMNDMAGDEPDSWKSILKGKGHHCEIVMKGTGEYPEIVDVWMDHLRAVYTGL